MQKNLRDWLPFGQSGPSLNDSARAPLESWRSPLASLDPRASAEELRRLLGQQGDPRSNPHARLKWLEACYQDSATILPAIETAVSGAALPLPADVLQSALAADNLLKAMVSGYLALIDTLRAQKVPASASNLVRISTLRAVQCLARRQQLACRAYATASSSTWAQLHATYGYARQQALTGYANGGRSLEEEYLGAILLAYADPSKFSRHDLVPLIECSAHFAPLAIVHNASAVSAEKTGVAQFLAQETNTHPGKKLSVATAEERKHGWIIDCAHLISALTAVLAHRQQGLPPTGNDPGTPSPMLRAVLNMWRGQPARRFSRQSFKPRGELVTGLEALVSALASDTVSDGSEWAILDESPDGFGLRYLRGNAVNLQVGELVGLRPRAGERLHVCMIRRVVNGGAARLELGLQEIAPVAFPFSLPNLQRGSAVPAVFFPAMPAHRGKPGALAAAGFFATGMRVALPGYPGYRALNAIEIDARYELWELTPQ